MKRKYLNIITLSIVLSIFLCAVLLINIAEELSNEQLTDLLFSLQQESDNADEFLVLPEEYQEPVTGVDGVYRLLIVGVDTDGKQITGRSDTMVLAVLNTRSATVHLVSFMRDLFVKIPGKGNNRLNSAYAFGGAELLKKTLFENFQVVVDGYIAVDFNSMIALVDSIGGVEISVLPEELKPLNGILEYYNYQQGRPEESGKLLSAGIQTLTGLQTMSYARIRKLDSDFNRVNRQQRTLSAIFTKLQKMDSNSFLQMMFEHSDRVSTDITVLDAMDLARHAFSTQEYTIEMLTIPIPKGYQSAMKKDAYVLIPNLKKNIQAIINFLQPK